ncbi:MAG TPA: patatin-like phospholipase family protein [Bacteroidia bacterium]|nr:patatin-like phospholipase family protein [Bacteroidia bacterium]
MNLVLSGGGARGVAHLGVVKRMLESGITINAISGVSAGAIAGAFIARGMSPDAILRVSLNNAGFHLRRPRFSLGFFSKKKLEGVLTSFFPENSFSALSIPLHIAAVNLNSAVTEFFSSGELIKPLLASAALPLIFPAVEINGSQYMDGGLLNNLPVEPFLEAKLPIIGVHVNPVAAHEHYAYKVQIIERSIELAINKNIRPRKRKCTLFIEPPELKRFSSYDFARSEEMFNIAYDHSKEPLEKFIAREEKHSGSA